MNTIVAKYVATVTLICAFFGTGSSQRVLDNSRATTNRVECNGNQFSCRNGECIPSELLCDGRADCSDQSDETQGECTKPELTCPDYAFRCSYGACVNGDATCNGVKDCIDNSDELLPRCPVASATVPDSNCGENDYRCKNGQCISSTSLCDGQIDCNDGSDETFAACGAFQCSPLVFRCNYGACIDGDLSCNGRRDCADGSDEDPLLCGGAVPTQAPRPTPRPTPTFYPTPVPTPIQPSSSGCLVPPQPQNGQWKFHSHICQNGVYCHIPQGVSLEPGSQLVYNCVGGYQLRGNTDVFCNSRGKWSATPDCVEIRCPALNSASTMTSCTRLGEWTSCDSPVLPNTTAEISCRVGYRIDTSSIITRRTLVKCKDSGIWDPDPITCVPACGVATTKQTPFIFNGTTANIADFPWHATLYKETGSRNVLTKEFTCGATIIHTKFLLTAAHCVFDETTKMTEDPNKFYIATGNVFRDYDSPFHNPNIVRKGKVKNIYRNCRYYGLEGNYATDIALLELEEELRFSGILLPACLDVSGFSEQILEPGVIGRVAGFGRTETGTTSAILQTINLPYISYSQCKSSNNGAENEVFIGTDKFCAGFTNGSAVCEGDSGGGLVFKKNDLWYVMGIVSVGLGVDTRNGEHTCDRFSYSLYTKVSTYMGWIQDVMLQTEAFNYVETCERRVRSPRDDRLTLLNKVATVDKESIENRLS